MKIERPKEWWMERARQEGDTPIAAGVPVSIPEGRAEDVENVWDIERVGALWDAIIAYSDARGGHKPYAEIAAACRDVDAAIARLRGSVSRPEKAWLLEADGSYWTGRECSASSFDADPNEAIRFARREDADRAKHWLLQDHAFAIRTTEHVWLPARSTPPETPA